MEDFSICFSCSRNLCFECANDPCCCKAGRSGKTSDKAISFTTKSTTDQVTVVKPEESKERMAGKGRPRLSDDEVTDPLSTGRKRAAKLFPLEFSLPCEWRNKKNCGGGQNPIIGCLSGFQKQRHHGPDKDPRNNSENNVHRICNECHNHWHNLNDATYSPEIDPHKLHEPVAATPDELAQNLVDWAVGKFSKYTKARIDRFNKEIK